MPRSRETTISAAARRAAKYRFHGTVARTISQDRDSTIAATASNVVTGTLTTWPSHAISSATAAPVRTSIHAVMTRIEVLLMPDMVFALAAPRIGRSTQPGLSSRAQSARRYRQRSAPEPRAGLGLVVTDRLQTAWLFQLPA